MRHVVVAEHVLRLGGHALAAAQHVRLPDAVDDGRVVLGVAEEERVGAQDLGHGGERGGVGDVARGEQQGRLLGVPRRQLVLQRGVQVCVARDVARAARPRAVRLHRADHGGRHRGVLPHAEVVVAAPHCDLGGGARGPRRLRCSRRSGERLRALWRVRRARLRGRRRRARWNGAWEVCGLVARVAQRGGERGGLASNVLKLAIIVFCFQLVNRGLELCLVARRYGARLRLGFALMRPEQLRKGALVLKVLHEGLVELLSLDLGIHGASVSKHVDKRLQLLWLNALLRAHQPAERAG
mmetsp:Transcript_44487/g.112087  ORF Transcript_44487/g.112087 Transcript_44487/m.112087 type:complete len:297 (-) Transcript_44487:239-1129(-)